MTRNGLARQFKAGEGWRSPRNCIVWHRRRKQPASSQSAKVSAHCALQSAMRLPSRKGVLPGDFLDIRTSKMGSNNITVRSGVHLHSIRCCMHGRAAAS